MKTIEEKAYERYISDLEKPKHKRMRADFYMDWAMFGAKEVLKWIPVELELPEQSERLINSSIPDIERTNKVLVLTNLGNVTDNTRLKMAVGDKQWVWGMGYESGEFIVSWRILDL